MKSTKEKLRIISHSSGAFRDRIEAGELLAEVLMDYAGPKTVVLGIPRGGLVVACEVAHQLKAPLDIVLSRKLGAPQNPELAIGSITESGEIFLDQNLAYRVGADEDYIERERQNQFVEIKRRSRVYRDIRPKIDLKNKDVIIIDDGVATGSTVQAAFWSIRQESPHKIIGAFPVGPEETLRKLCQSADEIICLKVPPSLGGVGQFYFHFEQVKEKEVVSILKSAQTVLKFEDKK